MAPQIKFLEYIENGGKMMMRTLIEHSLPVNHYTKKYIFICICSCIGICILMFYLIITKISF